MRPRSIGNQCELIRNAIGKSSAVTALRLNKHGAPDYTACWLDESENARIKRIAFVAHAGVWHRRVLITYNGDSGRVAGSKRGAGALR